MQNKLFPSGNLLTEAWVGCDVLRRISSVRTRGLGPAVPIWVGQSMTQGWGVENEGNSSRMTIDG